MDDRVPEVVWIALLMHVFGAKEGTEVATAIAKITARCAPDQEKAFAAASDYSKLSERQKRCVRATLNSQLMLEKAQLGLAALTGNYPTFPLNFLGGAEVGIKNRLLSTLSDLSAVVSAISDRHGYRGTLAQATTVYIYFVNNKLNVAPGMSLANFRAMEAYPNTEESRTVAGSVRAAVTGLLAREKPPNWRADFWNRGREISSCEVK